MGRVTVSVENSRQGGGCERVSEVPHGSGGGALLGADIQVEGNFMV